jgi:hypothetical protein
MYVAYETDDNYSAKEIKEWGKFLDAEIGTYYEVNDSASGEPDEYYIVVFDLKERSGMNKIVAFEDKLQKSKQLI